MESFLLESKKKKKNFNVLSEIFYGDNVLIFTQPFRSL